MKKIVYLSNLFLWLILLPVFAALPAPNQSAMPLDTIVAVVNQDVITETELNAAIARTQAQLQQAKQPIPDQATLRNIMINQLIYQKLQLQLAKQNNIAATPEQVDQAIQEIAQNNKLTLAQLKAKLKGRGFTFDDFRKQISDQITVSQLQGRAIGDKVNVTQDEITQYIQNFKKENDKKQYHVIDILIPLADSASSEVVQQAQQKAQNMMQQLNKGASLDQVAAGQENDLGWSSLADLPDAFTADLKKMRAGQIADPIRTANGFHIIKLIDVRGTNPPPPTRDQAEKILRQQQFMNQVNKWLMEVRKNAYIKIYNY